VQRTTWFSDKENWGMGSKRSLAHILIIAAVRAGIRMFYRWTIADDECEPRDENT
jgi:hypothetical protein